MVTLDNSVFIGTTSAERTMKDVFAVEVLNSFQYFELFCIGSQSELCIQG